MSIEEEETLISPSEAQRIFAATPACPCGRSVVLTKFRDGSLHRNAYWLVECESTAGVAGFIRSLGPGDQSGHYRKYIGRRAL